MPTSPSGAKPNNLKDSEADHTASKSSQAVDSELGPEEQPGYRYPRFTRDELKYQSIQLRSTAKANSSEKASQYREGLSTGPFSVASGRKRMSKFTLADFLFVFFLLFSFNLIIYQVNTNKELRDAVIHKNQADSKVLALNKHIQSLENELSQKNSKIANLEAELKMQELLNKELPPEASPAP